jgi:long-chain acyl-CoA synthetase
MKVALPENLHAHFADLAHKHPDKPALIACDSEGHITRSISYAELLKEIGSAAAYLGGLGLKEGDRVALAFGNSIELLIVSWAAWTCGIVTVPLDVKRDTPELYEYKIRENRAKVLLAQEGVLSETQKVGVGDANVVEFTHIPAGLGTDVVWKTDLSHLALILFTSGTTGHPKGAKLSVENLLVNGDGIREWLRITDEDRFLVNLPLHHINSTTFCLSALLAGASIAIPPAYSNSNFWGQMAKTGATFTSIVQSILFDQLAREKEFSSLRQDIKLTRIQIGSAPVVAHSVQEFLKKFGVAVYQGYGQTETALRVTGVPMGLSSELYEKLVEENCIGTAMKWADVQITNDKGDFLGEGEEGELVVKGPAVMEGYIGGEPAFRNGYFLTGDVGFFRTIDTERYFYLKGRTREIIIKGGVNISPVAVENNLKKISPDIDQAYVVGIAEERYGEEVGAVICWKSGIDTQAAMRRLKSALVFGTPYISEYETPRYLTAIDPGKLPMTSTGKVQRSVLKKTIPPEQFEKVNAILKTQARDFTLLDSQSRYLALSQELYNNCWQPLVVDIRQYKKDAAKEFVLLALDKRGDLLGQIALIRTNLSAEELLKTKYADLLGPEVSHPHGKAFVCVSICNADYRAKDIPSHERIPSIQEVEAYLPQDPVYKFHQKPKGGKGGAALIGLIPGGRPEDISALGYNMLLKYPEPSDTVAVTEGAAVSNQLIEAVLVIAKDLGIKDIFAFSRPGGLAMHMAG